MKITWWKVLSILLIVYSIVYGLTHNVPDLPNIRESIRNLYYHVSMWFAMMVMFTISFVYSIIYLMKLNHKNDIKAKNFTHIGLLFGILGMITGMIWANDTWGEAWSGDPKQLGAALCLLSYCAYVVLRAAIQDEQKRASLAAVYNIFAFAMIIPFIWILPSMTDSLHPGSGGNVGFNAYDLDNHMRTVFYPAVLGWILFGVWLSNINNRIDTIKHNIFYD